MTWGVLLRGSNTGPSVPKLISFVCLFVWGLGHEACGDLSSRTPGHCGESAESQPVDRQGTPVISLFKTFKALVLTPEAFGLLPETTHTEVADPSCCTRKRGWGGVCLSLGCRVLGHQAGWAACGLSMVRKRSRTGGSLSIRPGLPGPCSGCSGQQCWSVMERLLPSSPEPAGGHRKLLAPPETRSPRADGPGGSGLKRHLSPQVLPGSSSCINPQLSERPRKQRDARHACPLASPVLAAQPRPTPPPPA